ncbi:type II secretion system secretin GspD [Pseudokordiimonas caeni]|uniref:type II secretion system secretin GspD n=1 Tax=Pseudokordiimonas caeni TaxID=2997908 RepID=UPI002811924B|nr:type II secretion system secretin GspD [Pseudokordiimonas caeni]
MITRLHRFARPALLAALMLATPPLMAAEDHLLNFRDADVRALIDDIAMITGRTFIVDPRVKGKVTVISRTPVPQAEVFDVFLSALKANGFTAVATANGAWKIVPEEGAAFDAQPVGKGTGDQMVTQIFRLSHIDTISALNTVKPVVNPQGRVIGHRTQNFLVVVDYAANMDRVAKLIAGIDADRSVVELIPLKHSSAAEIVNILATLRGGANGEAPDSAFAAVPVTSSNSVILKGPAEVVSRMKSLVGDLDNRNEAQGDLKVVYLSHADGEALVPILSEVSQSLASAQGEATPGTRRATISFHKATNALVINASPEMQQTLEGVVRQLDIPRAQVLVEAIIVEISDNAAKELGLQYILAGGEGSWIPFTATNYSNTAPNVLAATGALVLDKKYGDDEDGPFSDGIKALGTAAVDSFLGMNGFAGGIAGQTKDGTLFGVILNAVASDSGSNILSTPSVMTMDNAEASILVGQEIPITTGEALGSANTNPFRTIDRKEVGVKLAVTPQINEGDEIRLNLEQEVSSVSGPVAANSTELVTNKREIKTTVSVRNGEIIVLGGLIEENERVSVEKVPLLGDIPVLGRAFRSEGKRKQKTNLMVFLRPTIVRSASDLAAVTNRKYGLMRDQQVSRSKTGESSLDAMMQDVIGSGEQN